MADAALKNAIARRDAERERIASMMAEITDMREKVDSAREGLRELEEFISMWYHLAGIQPPAPPERKESSPPPPPRPVNANKRDVALKCVEFIRKAGQPLPRAELFRMLIEDGVPIHGKNPEMVLSTMLWRTKDIVRRLDGGGYWPTGDPLPPGYTDDFEDLLR